MKIIVKTILILSFGYLVGMYYPFWALAVVAFVISLIIRSSALSSFISGFIAIFTLWLVLAYQIDQETNAILTNRIAAIFSVNNPGLLLLTGFIGGLAGGLGALSGSLFLDVIKKRRKRKYY